MLQFQFILYILSYFSDRSSDIFYFILKTVCQALMYAVVLFYKLGHHHINQLIELRYFSKGSVAVLFISLGYQDQDQE